MPIGAERDPDVFMVTVVHDMVKILNRPPGLVFVGSNCPLAPTGK